MTKSALLLGRRPLRRARQLNLKRWIAAGLALLLLAIAAVAFVGCEHVLARMIVAAPNSGWTEIRRTSEKWLRHYGIDREIEVATATPGVSLRAWIIEPRSDAAALIESKVPQKNADVAGMPRAAVPMPRGSVLGSSDSLRVPRGTVLVLHGIWDNKRVMTPIGRRLSAVGYRAVLVDHRGHGQSTGNWLGFGAHEVDDLRRVLDALERQHGPLGPVGIYGASYGAGVGIQFAAFDPRVRAVVAVAPFSSLRAAVEGVGKALIPGAALLSREALDTALSEAGAISGFAPESVEPQDVICRTDAGVLVIHGLDDERLSIQQGVDIVAARPWHSQLLVLPHEDHTSIMKDRDGMIAWAMVDWFDEWLTR